MEALELNSSEITDAYWNNSQFSNTSNSSFQLESEEAKNDFGQSFIFGAEISSWVEFIFVGVLLTAVSVLGVLGNILSVSVLARKKMRSSLSVLLIGLSFCDFLVCLIAIFLFGFPTIFKKLSILFSYLDWICGAKKYIFLFIKTAQTGSTYFTVAITFERYIAVCRPLQARSICTWSKARYFTIVLFIFSIVVNIPWYVMFLLKEEYLTANHTCGSPPSSSKNNESVSEISVRLFFYTIFMYLVPLITVTVVNGIIIRTIHQQNSKRDKLTRSQLKQIKLTNMLIVVISVYVVCNIFRVLNVVTKNIFNVTFAEIVAITNFLVIINSAINYLIYCAFGKTFRESFVNLFCKCGKRRRTLGRRGTTWGDDINMDTMSTELSMVQSMRRFSKSLFIAVGFSKEITV